MTRIAYTPGYTFRTTIYGRSMTVKVLRYHGAGTCDVEAENGRCYRVSGLPMVAA
jgi:hypothetical protein